MYSSEEMLDFLVSNLVKGTSWVGDFMNDEAHDNYMAYLKRKQSLTYTFSNELDALFTHEAPEHVFKVGDNHRYLPPILNARMSNLISEETYAILNSFLGFSKSIEKALGDNTFIWDKYNKPALKLHPFIKYDRDKMKTILKEKINEYRLPSEKQEASRAPQREGAQV
jgi:hypothetical protein